LKVLFVYRGYGYDRTNSVVDFQKASLITKGIEIESLAFNRGGLGGYIGAYKQLRSRLKTNPYDLLHAHYSYSGFVARLATCKPVICSLMGSDLLQDNRLFKWITWFFYRFFWTRTVVKSPEMKKKLPGSELIPNGVDMINFRKIPGNESFKRTGLDPVVKHILFVAQDPDSRVKNLSLAKSAIGKLQSTIGNLDPRIRNPEPGTRNLKLVTISNKPFEELPYYYNAADLLLLTSLSEGSPNVIKEAMACNCPIVSTDVGDVRAVIGDTEGCYITTFDPADVAAKIKLALAFGKRTNGREKIQHLDSRIIASRIIDVYNDVLKKKHLAKSNMSPLRGSE
jgi:glycosyltransferase involved in cell wall biosynthesis